MCTTLLLARAHWSKLRHARVVCRSVFACNRHDCKQLHSIEQQHSIADTQYVLRYGAPAISDQSSKRLQSINIYVKCTYIQQAYYLHVGAFASVRLVRLRCIRTSRFVSPPSNSMRDTQTNIQQDIALRPTYARSGAHSGAHISTFGAGAAACACLLFVGSVVRETRESCERETARGAAACILWC